MAELQPLERADYERVSTWAQLRDMTFAEKVSIGLVPNAGLLSYGTTVTGLSNSSGQVAFREGPALAYPTELSGDTVYLVSSSASDTGTYKIQGIDTSGDYAEATVTATGTTPVAFSGTWNHVQRCISTSANNVGTVYVSTDAAAVPTTLGDQIQTVMLPGKNYAINPLLVCPNDRTILIYEFDFSSNTDNDMTVFIEANREGMWIENFKFFVGAQFAQEFKAPVKLYEGDKLRVSCTVRAGTNNDATFGMNGVVITNSEFVFL